MTAKKPLIYTGPSTSLHIAKAKEKGTFDVRPLVTGQTYDDLPSDHSQVVNLMASGLLVPPSSEATIADSSTAKKGDAGSSVNN